MTCDAILPLTNLLTTQKEFAINFEGPAYFIRCLFCSCTISRIIITFTINRRPYQVVWVVALTASGTTIDTSTQTTLQTPSKTRIVNVKYTTSLLYLRASQSRVILHLPINGTQNSLSALLLGVSILKRRKNVVLLRSIWVGLTWTTSFRLVCRRPMVMGCIKSFGYTWKQVQMNSVNILWRYFKAKPHFRGCCNSSIMETFRLNKTS